MLTAGNLLVIIVILCNRKMRNDVNFFLVNLAIADLCVGIFCVMPNLYFYISQYWLLGRVRNFTVRCNIGTDMQRIELRRFKVPSS